MAVGESISSPVGVMRQTLYCIILYLSGNDFTESKVRIPAKMVGKLIGERGKTVVEISRDSKCRVMSLTCLQYVNF